MNQSEWKNLMRWLGTATDAELETRWLALATLEMTLKEAEARRWARRVIQEIRIELDARHAIRG